MLYLVRSFALILAWTLVRSNQREKVFFIEQPSGEINETLLVVTWTEDDEFSSGCEIFRDKDLIAEVVASSSHSPIQKLSGNELQIVLQDCTEFVLRRKRRETEEDYEDDYVEDYEEDSEINLVDDVVNGPSELFVSRQQNRQQRRQQQARNRQQNRRASRTGNNNNRQRIRTSTNDVESTTNSLTEKTTRKSTTAKTTRAETTTYPTTTLGYDGLPVIYPGTKWCGAGAIAKGYGDLGTYQDSDRCCRAHDLCNETLAPGETRYNLTNTSPFTKLSCRCDEAFYNCLSRVNSFTSNSIGNMYFNILRRECYKKEYPLTKKCKTYLTFLKITCLEYARDRTARKVYQWIPAQRYKNIPVPG